MLSNVYPPCFVYPCVYKGVVCNHIGPMNMIDFEGFFGCPSERKDVIGCSAPVIFDMFTYAFFLPFLNVVAISHAPSPQSNPDFPQ